MKAKKFFTLVALAAVTAISVLSFAACNSNTYNNDKLIVATNAEFAPFEMLDESGNPVGIDMELAAEIAKIMGVEYEISDMNFDSVIGAVESKKCNIGMAGLTITQKRLEQVDFCDTYFEASQVVIAKADSAIAKVTTKDALDAALEGKTIGYQTGTVGDYYVNGDEDFEFEGIEGATGKGYNSGALAVIALQNGQIDAVIIDKVPAINLVNGKTDVVALTDDSFALTNEQYAFAVGKGNTELKEAVNAALKTLKDNGKFDEIVNKYFAGV